MKLKVFLASLLFLFNTSICPAQKIGLVLGGGGAKGAAHVGALKVIEEAGIHVDYIAGTSIGAIVGGLYATGYTSDELEQLFCQQEWLSLLTDRDDELVNVPYRMKNGIVYLFGFPVYDTQKTSIGLLRGERIEQVLDSMMGCRGLNEFGELKIPFRCVATEFRNANEVVLSSGMPAEAMRASMAIPGVFKPVRIDGRLLVDGGMMNNLPVDVVRQMGADVVIAIDLQQNKEEANGTDLGLLSSFGDMLGISGLINWVETRPDVKKYKENVKGADIYINPSISDADATSFGSQKMVYMLKQGEQAARNMLPQLKALTEKTPKP